MKCNYLDRDKAIVLNNTYEEVIRMLVAMRYHPEQWIIRPDTR